LKYQGTSSFSGLQ